MNESKHTPGPWRLYTDAKGRVSKIESKTGRVCTIQPSDKNRDANAALIARAPDLLRENEELTAQNAELLEALEKVREVTRDHSEDDSCGCHWQCIPHDAFKAADAAIAKAKGGAA